MTTRTPPTADDLAGRSQRGKDAYNQRRAQLRALGITPPPDLYGQDGPAERDPHVGSPDDLRIAQMDDVDAELRDLERLERIQTAPGWTDRWLREQEDRRH